MKTHYYGGTTRATAKRKKMNEELKKAVNEWLEKEKEVWEQLMTLPNFLEECQCTKGRTIEMIKHEDEKRIAEICMECGGIK